jgi:hypothetical protein
VQGSGISLFREATQGDFALSTNGEGKSDRPSRTDCSCRATNAKGSIKDDGVSNEIFQLEKTDDGQSALLPERKLGKAQTLYLMATGLATLGWLWLIAWCALQLV